MLRPRRREHELERKALRARLQLGIDALRRGDADEVDEADLAGYLASLAMPRRAR